MKITLISLVLGLSSLPSHAVVTSVFTSFDIAFADSNNLPIPNGSGYISTGFFSGLDDSLFATSDIATIDAAFQPFTDTTGVFGNSGFPGFVNYASGNERVGPASPYLNQSLYAVFGNGSTLAESTDFAIFKASSLVFPDDSAAATDADLAIRLGGSSPTAGTFLVGTTGGTTDISGNQVGAVVMQQAVPEPSTLFLSALGVLGLLRRKR